MQFFFNPNFFESKEAFFDCVLIGIQNLKKKTGKKSEKNQQLEMKLK